MWGVAPPCRLEDAHVLVQRPTCKQAIRILGAMGGVRSGLQTFGLSGLSSGCGQAAGTGRHWGWGKLLPWSSSRVVTGISKG